MEKQNKHKQSEARFEFRSFGQDFQSVHLRMAALSQPVPQEFEKRTSSETYIVSPTNDAFNCKIRDDKFDIKKLQRTEDGLEQWDVYLKEPFPLNGEIIEQTIIPALLTHPPAIEKREYSKDEFYEMLSKIPELQVINVKKERFGYMINDVICEFGYVWINDTKVETVSAESTQKDDVLQIMRNLGMEGMENINYLKAIKRATGLSDKALLNE